MKRIMTAFLLGFTVFGAAAFAEGPVEGRPFSDRDADERLVSAPLSADEAEGASEEEEIKVTENGVTMEIRVESNGRATIFALNGSRAAEELYDQLPLRLEVEDFGGNEKIFYPPQKLGTDGTPRANAVAGTLAYYAPWGDVVMFYEDFGSASGLYELGRAVSGEGFIREMSGTILIDKAESP